jgi:transposase
MQITTIGLDIAKNVFQVHGIDAAEKVVVRKQLRRGQVLAFFKALPPCDPQPDQNAALQPSPDLILTNPI